jgi:hypothetical protein
MDENRVSYRRVHVKLVETRVGILIIYVRR